MATVCRLQCVVDIHGLECDLKIGRGGTHLNLICKIVPIIDLVVNYVRFNYTQLNVSEVL